MILNIDFWKIAIKHRKTVLALALIAIALRFWLVLPNAAILGDGIIRYDPIARNLAAGNGFTVETSEPFRPDIFEVPLYPAFIALIYVLSGNSLIAVAIVQIVLELLTIILIVKMATLLNLPERVKPVVATIGLMSPFLVVFSTNVMTEVVTTFSITAACYLLLKALTFSATSDSSRWWFAGLAAGACMLLRIDTVLCVGMMGLAAIVILRSKQVPWRRILYCVGAFTISVVVVSAPWTVRNYLVSGELKIPGAQQIINNTDNNYYRWLGTWFDDPKLVHYYLYWPQMWGIMESKPFPADKVPDENERRRAEAAMALARQQCSFGGKPGQEFLSLTNEAKRSRPLRTRLVVPVKRVAMAWIRLPNYLLWANVSDRGKIIGYVVWMFLLVAMVLGAVSGLLLKYDITLLIALVVSRSMLPFIGALGTEPRYMIEAYSAILLFAAIGVVSSLMFIRRLLFPKISALRTTRIQTSRSEQRING